MSERRPDQGSVDSDQDELILSQAQTLSQRAAGDRSLITRILDSLRRHHVAVSTIALIVVALLAGLALRDLTQEVSYQAVRASLADLGWYHIALALAATAASYLVLTFYDVSALDYIGEKRPYPLVAFVAFCGYAVGNTAGFGPLSGGAIRYRYYSRLGFSPEQIATIITFVVVAFSIGVVVVTGIGIAFAAPQVTNLVGDYRNVVVVAGILVSLGTTFLVAFAVRRGSIRIGSASILMPTAFNTIRQLVVTTVDLCLAGLCLYVLLPDHTIGYWSFIVLYMTAAGLAALSHVPAGLGVFETVMMAGLAGNGPASQTLAALVVYRVIYYAVPLVAAAIMVSLAETRRAVRHLGTAAEQGREVLSAPVLTAFSVMIGAMLIFAAVIPEARPDPSEIVRHLPSYFEITSLCVSALCGMALVLSGRGLIQRSRIAWKLALALTLTAFVVTAATGHTYFVSLFLIAFAATLLATRRQFDDLDGALLRPFPSMIPWIAAGSLLAASAGLIWAFTWRDGAVIKEVIEELDLPKTIPIPEKLRKTDSGPTSSPE
ncbi:lysylphosphatidylglycerol synthase domain-containing protein [Limoniibacter endophyticus]|uniref:Phosphatidylglycerol lysyltransferase n=1 Tax=Limoniibacter endophyticus TaxID=1565040 RepID=A0A8J3DKV1_9HYPH|nr:lysylphosphatidylglycerol synthase domain-containing protein [Limoniibacter endophyticus]GHC77641.1 hypothetical protein GCM10010136_29000 [Limoniibacter endophyticus]